MVCSLNGGGGGGGKGRAGESGLLPLTLLISCAAYSGDLLLDSLQEGCCTTDAGGVAEIAASLLDTGFCCGELETMYQYWVIGGDRSDVYLLRS